MGREICPNFAEFTERLDACRSETCRTHWLFCCDQQQASNYALFVCFDEKGCFATIQKLIIWNSAPGASTLCLRPTEDHVHPILQEFFVGSKSWTFEKRHGARHEMVHTNPALKHTVLHPGTTGFRAGKSVVPVWSAYPGSGVLPY